MKKLTRSQTNRKIAGVCGGLGKYFAIDPTIVRLIVILLALSTAVFPIVLCYILAVAIMPNEGNAY